jgi:thiol-disulfide isomerase/thioredoxin
MTRLAVGLLIAVLLLATAAGVLLRVRSGRVRTHGRAAGGRVLDPEVAASLGVGRDGVTLLQFSSAFCAPCRAARVVLARFAAENFGVHHVEVDAESHLGEVRALDVLRTPTTVLVGPGYEVLGRIGGVPRTDELFRAISPHIGTELPEPGS